MGGRRRLADPAPPTRSRRPHMTHEQTEASSLATTAAADIEAKDEATWKGPEANLFMAAFITGDERKDQPEKQNS